jgi:hypothetical protein
LFIFNTQFSGILRAFNTIHMTKNFKTLHLKLGSPSFIAQTA